MLNAPRVRSVDRAVDVLELMARTGAAMTLGQLCQILGAPRSTTWTIVRTLAARQVLEYETASRTYRPGPTLRALGRSRRTDVDLAAVARPHLARLAEATREAALLQMASGRDVVCAARIDSPEPIRYVAEVGGRRPLHCTAAGKVILAWARPGFVEDYLRRTRLRACSANTITQAGRLREELARIRQVGYAVSAGEYAAGLMAVAAPVLDALGELVAAINVAGPTFRMRGRQRGLAQDVTRVARAISADLGHDPGAVATTAGSR
jgi:IclR family acetate operon transcriptional repressor